MKDEIDTLSYLALQSKMKEVADKASLVAKQLQVDTISEDERNRLEVELEAYIAEGVALNEQKKRVESRLVIDKE